MREDSVGLLVLSVWHYETLRDTTGPYGTLWDTGAVV